VRRVPVFQEECRPTLKSGGVVLERVYRLLTPLFGGGVTPRYADPVSAVRATEIKGQLRFWWRAARAGGLTLEAMREKEAELFGAATGEKGQASPLVIEVEPLDFGQEQYPFYLEPGRNFPRNNPKVAPGYVAFPLQSNKQDPNNYPVKVGVRFRLRLRYPERLRLEIEAALWAWERFGGVGGRTRRGFGAIWPDNARPPTREDIQAGWSQYVRGGKAPEGVPSLSGAQWCLVERPWQKVVELYRSFRQCRNPGQHRPGRSHWPEPDAIRAILRPGNFQPQILKFPRAQFGLPIVVHFKDNSDPNTQIVPANPDVERLASPLIFRPVGERHSVVLILNTPRTPPGGVALQGGKPVDVELTSTEAQRITPLKGEADPLLAFLKQLQEETHE